MESVSNIKQMLESDRWNDFLESTAAGLKLNLVQVFPGIDNYYHAPDYCVCCQKAYPRLTASDMAVPIKKSSSGPEEFITDSGSRAAYIKLKGNLYLIARSCTCVEEAGCTALIERTGIAGKLLSSFQGALGESFTGGRRAVELLVLRQMNQIVLSVFGGEGNGLGQSLDLILSALVILLDAQGSWLECDDGERQNLIIKGDEAEVGLFLENDQGCAETVSIDANNIKGRLGVLAPADPEQAAALLPLLAQECVIAFEISHLFKLLQNRLTQVLGAVTNAVLLVDQRGNISYVNNAAEQIFGRPFLDIIGQPITGLPGPWIQFFKEKAEYSIVGRMDPIGMGPAMRWVDWQMSPVRDGETTMGWLILADDRTDHIRWQEAARQAERLTTTATMVGALAHEVRNPLSAARGLLQLIGRKREPEKTKGYTDLIMRELDRITRLLNEFLLLGRPAEMDTEPLDPVSFIHELTPLIMGEAETAGVKIEIDSEKVSPVSADQGQLTQVVLNLARNAVEAAGQDGLVRLSLRETPEGVTLSIKDSGPGLTDEVMVKMFRPFFTTKERGTGLGLAVVQAIVHNHGGDITACNAPEGGAVFTLTLPASTVLDGKNSKIDVVIAVADEFVSYPGARSLRAAGLKAVIYDNLTEALQKDDNYEPGAVIVEQVSLTDGLIDCVLRTWPSSCILVIGEPRDNLNQMERLHYIPRPVDYAGLTGKVQSLLNKGRPNNPV
jgi:PAS domain S-box-containing protein